MSAGRHAAAPSGARRAATSPAGGARAARTPGRRVAERPSTVAVIRAGSKGALAGVAPMAVLGVACVVGLGGGGGDSASAAPGARPTPSPLSENAHSGQGRHRAAPVVRHAHTAQHLPGRHVTGTTSYGVETSAGFGQPEAVLQPTGPAATDSSAPAAKQSAAPSPNPNTDPSPLPLPSATATPQGTVLTQAQATAACLQSGISALDVAGLTACVTDLLTP